MLKKEFLTLLLITFIVVVVWIVSDLIHALPDEKLSPELEAVLEPLNPNFNKSALDIIAKIPGINSANVSIQSINQTIASPQPTGTSIPTPAVSTPPSTPSPSLIDRLINSEAQSAF